MLLSVFVSELLFTLTALKLSIVQSIHRKTIDLVVKFEICATVRTTIVLNFPGCNALRAKKSTARPALCRRVNHIETNGAQKILIQRLSGQLRSDVSRLVAICSILTE